MSRKNVVIDQLTQGVSALLKKNKVDLIKARATTIKKNSIEDVVVCDSAVWIHDSGIEFSVEGSDGGSIQGRGEKIIPEIGHILLIIAFVASFMQILFWVYNIKAFNDLAINILKKSALTNFLLILSSFFDTLEICCTNLFANEISTPLFL